MASKPLPGATASQQSFANPSVATSGRDNGEPQGVAYVGSAVVTTGADTAAFGGSIDRQLEVLAAVARRTGNAVVVTNRGGHIDWVNEGFTRLTGYALSEVVGRRPGELLQGADTAKEPIAVMAAAIASGRPFDVVVLNYTKSHSQYWVHIEADPTLDVNGRVNGYIAIETDVSESRIAAGREEASQRVGDGLLSCNSIEAAARVVAAALTSTLDVRATQIWIVEPGNPTLRYLIGMCADGAGEEWLVSGRTQSFQAGHEWVVGVGAPGMAWGTRKCCVRTDFWQRDARGNYSRRAEAARRARIRTVCAVPVIGPEGVVAIIEIGGSHNFPGHERLPSLVERVAQQLASFIEQLQSRMAFEALFKQSPDALLLVDAAGSVTRANARASDLFGDVTGHALTELLDDAASLLTAVGAADAIPIYRRQATALSGHRFSAEVTSSATNADATPATIISVRDLTERHRAEEALQQSLQEKMTLVQEVHHRVKNNLQIISSLVSLQAQELDSEPVRAAFQDTSNRIHSMALVHQQLYASDNLAKVALDDYGRALCATLRGSLSPDAVFTFEADPVEVPIERAVPCGLILNELLTNAFKHGRDANGRCVVKTEIRKTETGFSFSVSDQGPGFDGEPYRRGSMGQTLIKALIRQLRAKKIVDTTRGTSIRIEVPDEDPNAS
jgi:PAS domain S-box-containing protein